MVRHHILNASEPDELFRHLLQLCTVHLEVRPLSSGRSTAVSGEVRIVIRMDTTVGLTREQIASHSGSAARKPRCDLVPQSSAVQYRLTDGGCVFFEKGTSPGIL